MLQPIIMGILLYSPMWWMLVNHNPSGSENGNDDNLSSWNYEQHAVYIASVVQYFAEVHNISATSVDAFNEPVADWCDYYYVNIYLYLY